ncbi:MAG: hypothetical protein LC127_04600 [Chitinophagales bacterium]|nr:hypothetical protein [Chitinophagales bacterium]
MEKLKNTIEFLWEDRSFLSSEEARDAVIQVVDMVDKGQLRVAEPDGNKWKVNDWVKKAIVLYFPIQKMETIEIGPFEFHDKIPLKKGFANQGVRVVPHAIARFGSFIESGAILMPSYVNIVPG